MIDQMVRDESKLRYAPRIAFYTFASLLRTDLRKAYEYGKELMVTSTYEGPDYANIFGPITVFSKRSELPAEIYQLGAEAYQGEIDQVAYPELVNIPKLYDQMADFCWRAKDQFRAIQAEQKAIEVLQSRKNFSGVDLAQYRSRLEQYKKSKL
jgi:hypothetical protein